MAFNMEQSLPVESQQRPIMAFCQLPYTGCFRILYFKEFLLNTTEKFSLLAHYNTQILIF